MLRTHDCGAALKKEGKWIAHRAPSAKWSPWEVKEEKVVEEEKGCGREGCGQRGHSEGKRLQEILKGAKHPILTRDPGQQLGRM